MFKKYFLILLAFIILASIASVISCERASITKIYVNEDNPNDYLELKPDGTFYLYEEGIGTTGEWGVRGNELRLSSIGFLVTGEIKGNKIIDDGGKIWVRKSNNFTSQLTDEDITQKTIKREIGKIVFVSDRDGNWEIYVMNSDGSGLINLTNNPADDVHPALSPDGKRITLSSDRDGNYEI